ncbi:forespore capture DNA-binding protein RefZ [Niallia taxi]|uniref:forespore capture DNA-binding protein RefZ n=1 Tax=Niallia taxi TaxID=2499688 RepID=UPI002E1F5295|nr:forespore capture DNA-binding protein RefZ [Niallia taxi]
MKRNSKEAIVESAITLFNRNGYDGTSIRDIAGHAKVNIANISYYFNGKHGLLEHCFTTYFENYMERLEAASHRDFNSISEKLKHVVREIIEFQWQNLQLTRFVLREVSIDSQVVREIMSTYYVKERYYLLSILEEGIEKKEFAKQSVQYSMIQLKSFLTMPFLNASYIQEVLHIYLNEAYFIKKYLIEINRWIDEVLCSSYSLTVSN